MKENRHISILGKEKTNKIPYIQLILKKITSIPSLLFLIYLKPLSTSSNARVLVFTIALSFLHFSADLSDRTIVPELEQLKVTNGIVEFDQPRRYGTNLMIIQKQATPLILTCSGGATKNNDCITKQDREEYRGKQAKVWWFEKHTLLGMRARLVQLQIDQKIVIPYEQQKEKYHSHRAGTTNLLLLGILLSIYLVGMPLRHLYENQKNNC
jgi:hypothetical protein